MPIIHPGKERERDPLITFDLRGVVMCIIYKCK